MGEQKQSRKQRAAQKKAKKKKKALKIALTILACIVIFAAGVFGYGYWQLSKVKTTSISRNDKDLGISDAAKANDDQVVNIAFFGVDSRTKDEPGHSDATMILSVDKVHKKIKMSSIMRDSYVSVEGHGQTKFTHAYAYGGPQLAIKTLNENFNMNIRDFVTVDFYNLENIINALGGVEINVAKDEVPEINQNMIETSTIEHKAMTKVTQAGNQTLNGMQAVAYSRIRHLDGGDFERTERQRTVLTALLNKIKGGGAASFSSNVSKLLPYVETSLSSIDIMKLGTSTFASGTTNIDQERFPLDGYCNAKTIDGIWYLWLDIPATTDQLHKYIYDDVKPVPGKPLF